MISIGEQLKTARERTGLDLDRISEDTNIAKRFLTALEEENFSVFPGDPYVIGFLRNYAEYLGLDARELINAFKNIRIQEQPVPVESLIPKRGPSPWVFAGGGVAVLAIVAVLALVLVRKDTQKEKELTEAAVRAPREYTLEAPVLEKRFYEGDTVLIPLGEQKYRILVAKISDRVAVESPIGRALFMLGEKGTLDLDRDTVPELQIFVNDFQKGDPSKGALITLSAQGELAAALAGSGGAGGAVPAEASEPAAPPSSPAAVPAEAPLSGELKTTVIFDKVPSPFPIVLTTVFRNYCMFRYEADRREREERYYHKGDQISINVTNTVKFWTSNAAASKTTVQATGGRSVDLDLGGQGEVAVKQLRWVNAEGGGWNLVLVDVP
ncbi:MAG: helix-turn-helix domain-containing protein [Treponema sp.]|nr:helix-turn-helix domain-containing protein [Treponema sp.]